MPADEIQMNFEKRKEDSHLLTGSWSIAQGGGIMSRLMVCSHRRRRRQPSKRVFIKVEAALKKLIVFKCELDLGIGCSRLEIQSDGVWSHEANSMATQSVSTTGHSTPPMKLEACIYSYLLHRVECEGGAILSRNSDCFKFSPWDLSVDKYWWVYLNICLRPGDHCCQNRDNSMARRMVYLQKKYSG